MNEAKHPDAIVNIKGLRIHVILSFSERDKCYRLLGSEYGKLTYGKGAKRHIQEAMQFYALKFQLAIDTIEHSIYGTYGAKVLGESLSESDT